MLCQMCLEADATIHMLDRPAADRFVEADYCQTCYHLKYVNPPASRPVLPRPRFTIKKLMIFAAVFAIPNTAVALLMRSGLITGTSAQIRDWTLQAILVANFFCGVIAAFILSQNWLQKAQWHKMTGGLVPMTQPRKLSLKEYLKLPLVVASIVFWYLAGLFLIDWLTPILWPGRRPDPALSTWILSAPLLAWVCLRLKSNRHVVQRVRGLWRGASGRERTFRALALSWSFVIVIVMFSESWMRWFSNPIVSLCALSLIALGGQVIFFSGAVAVTRRR